MNVGMARIFAERQRQIDIEGWSADHDDGHGLKVLEAAAWSYRDTEGPESLKPKQWPWDESWWKPKGRQRNLERAGALYLAAAESAERAHDYESRDRLRDQAQSCALLLDGLIN